jgi:hypothetical protein
LFPSFLFLKQKNIKVNTIMMTSDDVPISIRSSLPACVSSIRPPAARRFLTVVLLELEVSTRDDCDDHLTEQHIQRRGGHPSALLACSLPSLLCTVLTVGYP